MMHAKNLTIQLMPVLLLVLTIFLAAGCATVKPVSHEDIAETLSALTPPIPAPPVMEAVEFRDADGGLWLSYDDYRSLERNIIALREYAERLEVIIRFYTEDD